MEISVRLVILMKNSDPLLFKVLWVKGCGLAAAQIAKGKIHD